MNTNSNIFVSIISALLTISLAGPVQAQQRVVSYDSYNSYGQLLQQTDANGTPATIQWGHNGTKPLAIFENAQTGEAYYESFEAEEVGWRDGDLAPGLSTEETFTGRYSWKVVSGTTWEEYGMSKWIYAQDLDVNGTYVFEAWVKAPATHDDIHIQMKYQDASGWHYPAGVHYTGNGEWQLLRAKIDLSTISGLQVLAPTTRNTGPNAIACYWDDLRFYPADGQARSIAYDPVTMRPAAILDETNQPAYFSYDELSRLSTVSNANGSLLTEYDYFYAGASLSSTNPNSITTTRHGMKILNGVLLTKGYDPNQFESSPINTDTWDNIQQATPTGQSYSGDTDIVYGTGYPSGIGITHGDYFSVTWEGEIYLDRAETYTFKIYNDNYSFVEIFQDGQWIMVAKDISWRDEEGLTTTPITISEPGWYPVRMAFTEKDQWAKFQLNYETPTMALQAVPASAYRYAGPAIQTDYFDGLGRPIQTQQQDGGDDIVAATTYDAAGRPHKQYKPYRWDTNHSYDSVYGSHADSFYGSADNGRPFSETLYEASPLARPTVVKPDGEASQGASVRYSYGVHNVGQQLHAWTKTLDETGRDHYAYTDGWGRSVHTISDISGELVRTNFVYDALDRLVQVHHPNCLGSGQPSCSNPDDITYYSYNAKGELTAKSTPDADGNGDGDPTNETGISADFRYEYDAAGNLRFSQHANLAVAGQVQFTTYDAQSRPLVEGVGAASFTGLDGNSGYGFEADTANWKGVSAWDSKPSASAYPWDKFAGRLSGVTLTNTHGRLAGRAWRFMPAGIPQTATVQGVGVTGSESYRAADSLSAGNTVVDPGGSLTLQAGRIIRLGPGFTASRGSELAASINPSLVGPSGQGVSTIAGSNPWQVTLLSYDAEGRVADKWIWTGDRTEWDTHLSYQYNRQGQLTRQQVTVGSQTLYQHYEYNQRGLLASVYVSTDGIQPATPEVSYTYTATGAIDNIDFKGSRDANYAYTIRDWVASINNVASPGGNFAASYDYTDNGNVEKAQFYNPQVQSGSGGNHMHWLFSYDALNRLTGADFGTGSGTGSSKFDVTGLAYDKNGNIATLRRDKETGALIDNLTYNYGGSNRLQSVADAVSITTELWDAEDATFGYDPNGNLTGQSGKFDDTAYDHRNLPIHFYLSSGDEVIANYNGGGQRILKEFSGGSWQFYVKDGPQTLAVIDNTGFSHFNLVGNTTFGRWEPGGTRRYYLKDHLGSTRTVVDNNGNVLEAFDYYPFGLLMPKRNTANANTLEKFTGKERDTEGNLNLDYFGARYYDPALGRWHSVDPLAREYPSLSPYNYVANKPVNAFDPDGQQIGCIPCLLNTGKNLVQSYINNFGNDVVNNPEKRGRIAQASEQLEGTEISVFARGSAGNKNAGQASLTAGSIEIEVSTSVKGSEIKGSLNGPEASFDIGGSEGSVSTFSLDTDGEVTGPGAGIGVDGVSASQNVDGQSTFEVANPGPLQVGVRGAQQDDKNPIEGAFNMFMEFIRSSLPKMDKAEEYGQ